MIWWAVPAGVVLAGAAVSLRFGWWRRPRRGIPILLYHQVGEPPSDPRGVSTRVFTRQLDYLAKEGYQTLTLSQALRDAGDGRKVVITFDNGYADFFHLAWPLLAQRGMTATVFVVTKALDGTSHWEAEPGQSGQTMMTRQQVRDLAARGVEFGGHGHSHRSLAGLDEKSLRLETVGCQKVLSDLLGRSARVFSLPYGQHDDSAVQALNQAGFDAACTALPGLLGTAQAGRFLVPRIPITQADGPLDFKLKLTRGKSRWRS